MRLPRGKNVAEHSYSNPLSDLTEKGEMSTATDHVACLLDVVSTLQALPGNGGTAVFPMKTPTNRRANVHARTGHLSLPTLSPTTKPLTQLG